MCLCSLVTDEWRGWVEKEDGIEEMNGDRKKISLNLKKGRSPLL